MSSDYDGNNNDKDDDGDDIDDNDDDGDDDGDDEDDYDDHDDDDPPSTLMRALVWRPSGVVSSNSSPSLKQKIMMIIHVVEVWLKLP